MAGQRCTLSVLIVMTLFTLSSIVEELHSCHETGLYYRRGVGYCHPYSATSLNNRGVLEIPKNLEY